ncbi:metallophosphoesterase domain-containing protein 1-like [Mya arenaria]|uniref:metallophosphoesterase domain-containing protein 1-like n=1 Tax=Mya arenaria TaxID=6604 RepID=UPI0022E9161D|nr:metallophosphoesterase domain-containing protein 1-like [Mya arenaria]XP_052798147.1 metallophosphoesterase domain-containing protein 1-like [Mya arenaria]
MSIPLPHKVYKVGDTENPNARIVRVVHISDTHMQHDDYKQNIPEGDILIHSGDFSQYSLKIFLKRKSRERQNLVSEMNSFFGSLPFKHKVLVPGNHEMCFSESDKAFLESHLTEVIYLQDKSVQLEGLNIFGSPWTANRWYSYADSFTKKMSRLHRIWSEIPETTDILVTHMPPFCILDLATKKFAGLKNLFGATEGLCDTCSLVHAQSEHWGCRDLKKAVLKNIRPVVHMFGHVHEGNGVETVDGVTFSNAAMKLKSRLNVFDVHVQT